MVKYLSFHNSSICLKILFNVNGKATVWHTPCYIPLVSGNILFALGRTFFGFIFLQSSQFQNLSVAWGFGYGARVLDSEHQGFDSKQVVLNFEAQGLFIYLFQARSFFFLNTLGIKNLKCWLEIGCQSTWIFL